MSKILVVIADGSEEIEAVTIIDTLRRAKTEVIVASVNDKQITASRGVRIVADAAIAECTGQKYDLIVLPGGMPGAEHLRDCKELIKMLGEQKQAGRYYAAICASPAVVLQHHGLLEGHKATCYPSMMDQLKNPVKNATVVVDGNCITSQGPATALEFSLKLVELLEGKAKAKEVAEDMLAKLK